MLIDSERIKRLSILKTLGAKKLITSEDMSWEPICTVMFRLGRVYSDVIMKLSDNDQFWKIKADFERNYDALVYHAIYTEGGTGAELVFLYISRSDGTIWDSERSLLAAGKAIAYIYNLSERYDDILPIRIAIRNGMIIRKDA